MFTKCCNRIEFDVVFFYFCCREFAKQQLPFSRVNKTVETAMFTPNASWRVWFDSIRFDCVLCAVFFSSLMDKREFYGHKNRYRVNDSINSLLRFALRHMPISAWYNLTRQITHKSYLALKYRWTTNELRNFQHICGAQAIANKI